MPFPLPSSPLPHHPSSLALLSSSTTGRTATRICSQLIRTSSDDPHDIVMKIITYVSVALGLVSAVASTATQIAQNGRTSSLERLLRLASRRKTKQASSFRSAAASQLDSSAVPKANSTVCGSDCESTLSFAGQAAAAHAVGSDIPGFPIPLKKSWAGNIPVGPTNPNATLFFWLWGAEEKKDTDDL